MTPKQTPVWSLALVALAFALTLHDLAADSLWGDEIFTASFASRSFPEVIRWTANDIHPPLYYLIVGSFTYLIVPLGLTTTPTLVSDWLWRFPSVIAVVLTIALTYRIAYYVVRMAYHPSRNTHYVIHTISISASLLLTLAPIAIKYGQEARMHALFMCFSTLSTYLFLRAIQQPRRWGRWLAFALATTANIYTMYFGFLILTAHAALLLALLIHSPFTIRHWSSVIRQVSLVGFTSATLLSLLLYIPWWPVLLSILQRRAAVGAIEGGVGSPVTFLSGVVAALGPQPPAVAWGFFMLFLIGLIFLGRARWPLAIFGALWFALPTLLPLALGDPRALQFRYAFVLPIYLLIIAYAVITISNYITNYQLLIPNLQAKQPTSQSSNPPSLYPYLLWLLATLSFIATLGIYQQTKPNWREATAYLTAHTRPADLILVGPLWDEGRFIAYYYQGQAQLLTPAALVTNIQGRAEGLRLGGGRVWAINRFAPAESPAIRNLTFSGVVISEPQIAIYEPELLATAAIDLAAQAVDAAYPWAAEAEAQGVLNPDPRTAQAAALRAWGDGLVAAGRPQEALAPYQKAVDIFPGWVNGFIVLAETQEALGNLPAAAQAYQQAVAFNLTWQGPLVDEATKLVEMGQWTAAIETYHQIIDK
jgi:uncharacterized membrane protein